MTLSESDQFSELALASEEEWIACTAWEYDTSFWRRTIIMDFDLVCDVSVQLTGEKYHDSPSEIRTEEAAAATHLPRLDVRSLPERVDQ